MAKDRKALGVVVATLPASPHPWLIDRCGDGLVCCNPDHPPVVISRDDIVSRVMEAARRGRE